MQNTESITRSLASEMPRKVLFIVNPNAGKRVSDRIIETIRKEFPENIYYQMGDTKFDALSIDDYIITVK